MPANEKNEIKMIGILPSQGADPIPVRLAGEAAGADMIEKNEIKMVGVLPSQGADPILVEFSNIDDFLENPPIEDETGKAPTSEWAFDHKADASAHHAKYTDVNARTAIYASLPAFHAYIDTAQNNVTGDDTTYSLIGDFWTEIEDNLNNFVNGTFTAPITGLYLFTGYIYLLGVGAAHTTGRLKLITSNREYFIFYDNFGAIQAGALLIRSFSIIADMDVGDTAFLRLNVYAGAKTVDIAENTIFSGVLLHR